MYTIGGNFGGKYITLYVLTWSYCCIGAIQVKPSPSETKVLNDVKNLFWFLGIA